mgnify:CR=1 FL=1
MQIQFSGTTVVRNPTEIHSGYQFLPKEALKFFFRHLSEREIKNLREA